MFLYQPSSGYRYNSDSIFLYDFVRRFSPRGRTLDVGCGVGIVGLLVARDWPVEMDVIDKQPEMVAYARHNFAINALTVEARVGDFAEYVSAERYDMIVSNPPFYDSAVTQSEDVRLNTARYAHHLPVEELIEGAKRLLRPRGYFVFVYDAKQIDAVLSQLRAAKLNPEAIRFVHPKADREAKVALIAARANSRAMLRVLPPLIVFDEQSRYLPEAQAAFDRAATHSITGDRS
jgi:tRNA1(Val) A37 N6-methylase TrmN6